MKYKNNEAPNVGVGRSRANASTANTSKKKTKGSNSNNDSNSVRRSSRRATIERRVWAVPKKGNKFILTTTAPSAKRKGIIMQSKNVNSDRNTDVKSASRDRKMDVKSASSDSKMDVKSASNNSKMDVKSVSNNSKMDVKIASKRSQGVKRGSGSLDDGNHGRKKVKTKSSEENVGEDVPENILNHSSHSGMKSHDWNLKDQHKFSLNDETNLRKEYLLCSGSEWSDVLEEDGEKCSSDSRCDIGKEETMCLDDVSLHKAVIVEVVSDCVKTGAKKTFGFKSVGEDDSKIKTHPKITDSTLQDHSKDVNRQISSSGVSSVTSELRKTRHKSGQNQQNVSQMDIDLMKVTKGSPNLDHSCGSTLANHSKLSENYIANLSSKSNSKQDKISRKLPVPSDKSMIGINNDNLMSLVLNGDALKDNNPVCHNRSTNLKELLLCRDSSKSVVNMKTDLEDEQFENDIEPSKSFYSKDLQENKDIGSSVKGESPSITSSELENSSQSVDMECTLKDTVVHKSCDETPLVLRGESGPKSPKSEVENFQIDSHSEHSDGHLESDGRVSNCDSPCGVQLPNSGSHDMQFSEKEDSHSVQNISHDVKRGSHCMENKNHMNEIHSIQSDSYNINSDSCSVQDSQSIRDVSEDVERDSHSVGSNSHSMQRGGDSHRLHSDNKIVQKDCQMSLQLSLGEEEDGEDHVSLSAALAQLVDGCEDEEIGSETLTIHSAVSVQVGDETKHQRDIDSHLNDTLKQETTHEDETEEEHGKLLIREDEDNDSLSAEPRLTQTIPSDEMEENDDIDDPIDLKEEVSEEEDELDDQSKAILDVKIPEEKPVDSAVEKTSSEVGEGKQSVIQQKPKKALPPLIKISSRPLSIKTPLKCPECPMQFCTVRSLFWHFGLHGARSEDSSLPQILLQDLIVPWEKPSVSLLVSQAKNLLEKVEKSYQQEEVSYSDLFKSPSVSVSSSEALSSSTIVPSALKISESVSSISKSVTFSSSSQSDSSNLDSKNVGKDQKKEESTGSNGDVILKIPIPRLKRKQLMTKMERQDKFVNILPKLPNQKRLISRMSKGGSQSSVVNNSKSLSSQISSSLNSPLDLVTVTPQSSLLPKITVMSSDPQLQIQPITSTLSSDTQLQIQPIASNLSSTSQVQIQPLTSMPSFASSQFASGSSSGLSLTPTVKNAKNKSTASHLNFIPTVSQSTQESKLNPSSMKLIAPSQKGASPMDGIIEKDGLVMINSNLALRIVSSIPSILDTTTNTTDTISFKSAANPSVDNLTIVPQVEGSTRGSLRDAPKNPDILTIVPQIDLKKRLALMKNAKAKASINGGQVADVGAGSDVGTESQMFKVLLFPSSEVDQKEQKVDLQESLSKLNGIEFKPIAKADGKEQKPKEQEKPSLMSQMKDYDDNFEDDDDDEGNMVIADVKEETEEEIMDPLSLCAVTMEDELMETSKVSAPHIQMKVKDPNTIQNSKPTFLNPSISHPTSQVESPGPKEEVNVETIADDKLSKIEVMFKGKKKKMDIVNYEARKYVCVYCDRRFGWSTDLKRHVILHTGERPFQCKVCPTSFTRKFLLQNHMKRMHPDSCKTSDLWP